LQIEPAGWDQRRRTFGRLRCHWRGTDPKGAKKTKDTLHSALSSRGRRL
jgi:hypothetical protein